MKQAIDTPMTFEARGFADGRDMGRIDSMLPSMDAADELDWLMSLALDDALDADEAARLDVLLDQAAVNMDRWEQWQMVDSDFQNMPSVLPPIDFVDNFAARLQIQERQRRLRTGVIFGVAAVALWGSVLTGLVLLGAMLWSNQGTWLAEMIHNTAYWWTGLGQLGEVWLRTVEALLAAPQARVMVACYVVAAVAILVGWFTFLQRSTREMPLGDVPMMEA